MSTWYYSYPYSIFRFNFKIVSFLRKALLMENVQGRCNVTSKQATLCMTTPHVPGNYHLILKLHLYVYLVQINLLIISFNLFPLQILVLLYSFADQECSGTRECKIRIGELIYEASPCPRELSSYFEAAFVCLPGT